MSWKILTSSQKASCLSASVASESVALITKARVSFTISLHLCAFYKLRANFYTQLYLQNVGWRSIRKNREAVAN